MRGLLTLLAGVLATTNSLEINKSSNSSSTYETFINAKNEHGPSNGWTPTINFTCGDTIAYAAYKFESESNINPTLVFMTFTPNPSTTRE